MKTSSMPVMSDEQLWRRIQAGDREAFGLIVERYQSLICALAYSACGDLGRSEDLAQETFLAAWQKPTVLREPVKLRSWLCGIVRNKAASVARRDCRRGVPESLEAIPETATPDDDPAARAITEEEAALLWRTLAELPESCREPLVLFYREQQSVAQVAEGLDLSEDVVRQRLSRGRALLRGEMAALVETTLTRTRPGAAFALGVLAALPLISPPAASAAVSAAVKGKGATALAKSALAGAGWGAIFGPLAGLFVGLIGAKAVGLTARSERERVCIFRHCRRMILSCFALCGLLVLALDNVGKRYVVTTFWLVTGILAWVGILVGTILLLNSWMQRDVKRVRSESGFEDMARVD